MRTLALELWPGRGAATKPAQAASQQDDSHAGSGFGAGWQREKVPGPTDADGTHPVVTREIPGDWFHEPAGKTFQVPKGSLWARGMAMAEAEIGRGWEAMGRWRAASREPEALLPEPVPETVAA